MANVLGTDYVTVLDMATAYATIAAEGVRANPYIVKEIRFQDKSVPTIKAKVVKQQVFDKDLMSDVIDAMTYPVEGGTARYVGQNLGRPAAGKTGTSESFRSAWFNGYVPQLQAAVGLYRSGKDGEELPMEDLPNAGSITGGTYPARIWTAYMEAALEGSKVVPFPEPAGINKDADPPPPTTERAADHDERARRPRRRAADHEPRRRPDPGAAVAQAVEDQDQRAAQPDGHDLPGGATTRQRLTGGPRLGCDAWTTCVTRCCHRALTTSIGGPRGRRLRPLERGPLARLAPVVLLLALPLSAAALRQAGCLARRLAGQRPGVAAVCGAGRAGAADAATSAGGLTAWLGGGLRTPSRCCRRW